MFVKIWSMLWFQEVVIKGGVEIMLTSNSPRSCVEGGWNLSINPMLGC
jgi:hypothetical protein